MEQHRQEMLVAQAERRQRADEAARAALEAALEAEQVRHAREREDWELDTELRIATVQRKLHEVRDPS